MAIFHDFLIEKIILPQSIKFVIIIPDRFFLHILIFWALVNAVLFFENWRELFD